MPVCERCLVSKALGVARRFGPDGLESFAFLCYPCRKAEEDEDPAARSWLPAGQ